MAFVQAKCTNCGGELTVDEKKDAAICPYCNTPYIVEKAINHYNVTNNVTIKSGSTVNIYGKANTDFEVKAGTLLKYTGESSIVVIPNGVTRIGEYAFCEDKISSGMYVSVSHQGLDVTEVTIPKSVTSIDRGAFLGCKRLKKVIIEEGLQEISQDAFKDCIELEVMTIPASAVKIDESLFTELKEGNNISIKESNPNYSWENNTLFNKSKTKLIRYYGNAKEYIVPNGVKTIYKGAFINQNGGIECTYYYKFEENANRAFKIVLPESIEKIEDHAFYHIINIVFPERKPLRQIQFGKRACEALWMTKGLCSECGGHKHLRYRCVENGYDHDYYAWVKVCGKCGKIYSRKQSKI